MLIRTYNTEVDVYASHGGRTLNEAVHEQREQNEDNIRTMGEF